MIKEQEKQLFSSWEKDHTFDLFLKDGIFDEDEWNNQPIKILYVLKEANFKTNNQEKNKKDTLTISDFCNDLCNYLLSEKSPTYWKTWNNIVRWTQAIRYGGEYQRTITKADKTKCLKTIAALNIKKEAGSAVANNEEILQYGKRDAEYLRQQIELYQSDIIICCGRGTGKNADILHDYVLKNVSDWQKPIETYNYFLCRLDSSKIVPVISFRHPQIRGGHVAYEKSYLDMMTIATEMRNRKHIGTNI